MSVIAEDNNRDGNYCHIVTHFGDVHAAFAPNEYLHRRERLFDDQIFVDLKNQYSLDRFVFLHQQHTVTGYVADDSVLPFATVGDYLITNKPRIALGIMTADCLPVIAIDRDNGAIGIAHAGWRGAVKDIVSLMLHDMQQRYGTLLPSVEIVFGPAARSCCYQVDQPFIDIIRDTNSSEEALEQRDEFWYFDLVRYVTVQMVAFGVQKIDDRYAVCTICNLRFCSYRRQKEAAERQMSIVLLQAL